MGLKLAFEAADLFGLSALCSHALSNRPTPQGLGLTVPRTLGDIPDPNSTHARFDSFTRRELASKLESAIAPLSPHVAVLDSIRSLCVKGATCIVAGQQPGLFGGPVFNSYKALHVAKLAQALSRKWGKPVVPILWNHADDHNLSNVHHAWFINEHVDLVKLHLAGTSSGRTPVSKFICTETNNNLISLRARLADLLAHEPNINSTVELAMPRHGESLARAWTRFHLDLFGHLGVVVIEPDWIRNGLSESLTELVSPSPLAPLKSGSERLKKNGFSTTINPSTAALAFLDEGQSRVALRPHGNDWRLDGEPGSRTPKELAAEIVGNKTNYSAGALLRPLVQDMTLPVSAYVGGFGELAYHAQLVELRQERGLGRGVFVPRLSCTQTDARCRKSLNQFGVNVGSFLRNPDLSSSESSSPSSAIAKRLRYASNVLRESLFAERSRVESLDPRLATHLKRTANQAQGLVDKLAERVERIEANGSGSKRRGQRRLNALLWPRALPQERVITTGQLLARFGRNWIDELFESIEALPVEHLVAHIDSHQ